jgi:hypothetical protein
MNLYRTGLSVRVHPSVLSAPSEGVSMLWRGVRRGQRAISLYQRGLGRSGSRERVRSSGVTDSVTDFLLNVVHIMLIVGGMWLLASALFN